MSRDREPPALVLVAEDRRRLLAGGEGGHQDLRPAGRYPTINQGVFRRVFLPRNPLPRAEISVGNTRPVSSSRQIQPPDRVRRKSSRSTDACPFPTSSGLPTVLPSPVYSL